MYKFTIEDPDLFVKKFRKSFEKVNLRSERETVTIKAEYQKN